MTEPPARLPVRDIAIALWEEITSDHVLMVAAGLGFYAMFGLLPAVAAAAALWGHFAGFDALAHAAQSGNDVLPHQLIGPLKQFVTNVPEGFGGGLALVINLGLVVFSAYEAATGLITALNIVYDVMEQRSRLRRAAVGLVIGGGGILLLFVAIALISLPLFLTPYLGGSAIILLRWLRWPVLGCCFLLGLTLLFRYGPCRDLVRWRRVFLAALTTAGLWVGASVGVSIYADHIASFGRFYGSLAGIAVVLMWFYVSAAALLAGAEIDGILTAREERREPSALKSALRGRERAPRDRAGRGGHDAEDRGNAAATAQVAARSERQAGPPDRPPSPRPGHPS